MSDYVIRTVRFPRDLFERIEQARGRLPREAWVRDACELALQSLPDLSHTAHQPGPNVENIRSTDQVKRDVLPIPKEGKK